jgi:endonuclease YncB( thermonuclease family)
MNPTAASACLIVATTSLLACSPAMYPHVAAGLQMIDGDTIVWRGERWRLANHDAPEIVGHCARERELAWRAKRRLEELLRGPYTLQRVPCWHGYARDRYGRRCAIVRVGGKDVADVLIAEGLAVKFPQPSRHRPWCL